MTTAMQVHTGEPPAGKALEIRRPAMLRPIAAPAEVIAIQEEARELVAKALKRGRDYGEVPGTDRDTLLKPGAERLTLAFGLVARFRVIEKEADHDRVVQWRKEKKVYQKKQYVRTDTIEGQSLGLYRVVIECELVNRETGEVVGSSIASCSTLESKYVERPRDSENTVYKMASKRAHVGATLNALGLSDQFTQDVEDQAPAAASSSEGEGAGEDPNAPPPVDMTRKCPKCAGRMYDNRQTKRNPKAPDFKCQDRSCDGVIWPPKEPKEGEAAAAAPAANGSGATASGSASSTSAPPLGSLAWAMELPLLGKPTSWTHEGISYGRKPIGTVPSPALKQAKHFIAGLIESNPNDERAPSLREQVEAIALVLDERAKLDPTQERLDLDADTPQTSRPAAVAAAVAPADEIPF